LTIEAQSGIIYNMENEENGMEWDEGSDVDNWETEQVFQDHEGQEPEEPREDFGYFGEMGMMED
jgi:hypothetical protein|tara:strand:- start:17 stop:208 length:192 start_codon:yes stop_codon:yes gene_type:complete